MACVELPQNTRFSLYRTLKSYTRHKQPRGVFESAFHWYCKKIPGVYRPGDKWWHCTDGNLIHVSVCVTHIDQSTTVFKNYSPEPPSMCTEGLGANETSFVLNTHVLIVHVFCTARHDHKRTHSGSSKWGRNRGAAAVADAIGERQLMQTPLESGS